MRNYLLLLLTAVWVARDAHSQLLMANIVEKLPQSHKYLPFIVEGVPHPKHGGTPLHQVPRHPLRVVLITSRLGPVRIGLREGQPKEAMADHIAVNSVRFPFVEMVQDPFVGIEG